MFSSPLRRSVISFAEAGLGGGIVVGFHADAAIVGVSDGRKLGCHGGKHYDGMVERILSTKLIVDKSAA